jgi:hypothetical protein
VGEGRLMELEIDEDKVVVNRDCLVVIKLAAGGFRLASGHQTICS